MKAISESYFDFKSAIKYARDNIVNTVKSKEMNLKHGIGSKSLLPRKRLCMLGEDLRIRISLISRILVFRMGKRKTRSKVDLSLDLKIPGGDDTTVEKLTTT